MSTKIHSTHTQPHKHLIILHADTNQIQVDSTKQIEPNFYPSDLQRKSNRRMHQKQSAITRKQNDPKAFSRLGQLGAKARHAKTPQEESDIARRAADTRKKRDPKTFSKMGQKGAKARHAKTDREESAIARRAAATRKIRNPNAFSAMGQKGAKARHAKTATEESAIACRAAATRKSRDPKAFSIMGQKGAQVRHAKKREETKMIKHDVSETHNNHSALPLRDKTEKENHMPEEILGQE